MGKHHHSAWLEELSRCRRHYFFLDLCSWKAAEETPHPRNFSVSSRHIFRSRLTGAPIRAGSVRIRPTCAIPPLTTSGPRGSVMRFQHRRERAADIGHQQGGFAQVSSAPVAEDQGVEPAPRIEQGGELSSPSAQRAWCRRPRKVGSALPRISPDGASRAYQQVDRLQQQESRRLQVCSQVPTPGDPPRSAPSAAEGFQRPASSTSSAASGSSG